MALADGQYVRIKMAPYTRMGTIEGCEERRGRTFYVFRQDPRLKEAVPGFVFEALLLEDELEPCERPSDDYWNTVNHLYSHGRRESSPRMDHRHRSR